jgi:hypothetical protein
MARVSARDAAMDVAAEAVRWIAGCEARAGDGGSPATAELDQALNVTAIHAAQRGQIADMDAISLAIVEQDAAHE